MAPEQTTRMFLSVDLNCSSCYKKVKKVICKIPQIRDQIYNEKENVVQIKVVCCSPEKIRDKLCYMGGGVIKSIEILDPPQSSKPAEKPKEAPKAEKPKEAPKAAEKPKEAPKADKPKEAPKADKPKEAPKPEAEKPKEAKKPEKPKDADKPKEAPKEKPKGPPAPEPVPVPMKQLEPISNVPALTMMPVTHGFPPPMYCYEPSYEWYGTPVAPPPPLPPPPRPCYDNYPNWCRCGQARGYYGGCRCDYTYFSEENTSGCTIM